MGFLKAFKMAWDGDLDDLREGETEFASLGVPALSGLRDQLESGAIAPAQAWEQAGGQLEYFLWQLPTEKGLPTAHFTAWHEQAPTAITAALVGGGLVRDAWEIRSGAVAQDVDESAWEPFFAKLTEAEEFLAAAVDEFPESHLPWVPLITTARGLQADVDEKLGRLEQANDRKPWDFYACEEALQGIAHKWSDDSDVPVAFARHIIDETAPGNPARAMLAHAAIEKPGRHGGVDPKLSKDEYEELAEVFRLFVAATPTESTPEELQALGSFLAALGPRDRATALATDEALGRLRNRCGGYPWYMSDDPLGAFDVIARQRARAVADQLKRA